MRRLRDFDDMNYYEILNLSPSASQQEIEEAYRIGRSSFAEGGLAHYGMIEDSERKRAMQKIEEAFNTLGNPKRRKKYDVRIMKTKSEAYENAYFRSSTERMIIESEEQSPGIWKKIRDLFVSKKRR